MEEDLAKLDALFDSILDEIIHPEKAGAYKNPFLEQKSSITELAEAVSVIIVRISDDSMTAYATVMAKTGKCKPFTAEDIRRAATTAGVFNGLDENVLRKMEEQQLVNREVVIATGTPAINGADGEIHLKFQLDEKGERANIPKDAEIMHVLSPKHGRDGKDVRGRMLNAVPGKSADFIIGEGIYKKGTRFYAEKSGKLTMRDDVYSIVNELVLDENIDQTSGIIGYEGTIIINGNVSGKGVVRAGGSVIVHGIVSGAVIEAVKNIQIDGRANDSSLSATEGNVSGKDFVDCTIVSGGNINAETLQNCTAKCVTGIDCTAGYGKITGGEIYSAGDVTCLILGGREHSETHLVMGEYQEYSDEIEKLSKIVSRIDGEIGKINDQVNDIRDKEKNGIATLEDESFLDAAIRIRSQKAQDKAPLVEKIRQLSSIVSIAEKATLTVRTMIFGGAVIKINGNTQIINSDRGHATLKSNGNNIVIL